MIAVFIPGQPATQGSIQFWGMSKKGNAILTSDNKRLHGWRNQVRAHILDSDGEPICRFESGPVHLDIEFVLSRPDSAPKKKTLSADSRRMSDIDKLERAILDAISDAKVKGRVVRGVLRNDVQVVSVSKIKRIAEVNETPGCHLFITKALEFRKKAAA